MAIVRQDPFSVLQRFQDDVNRLFNQPAANGDYSNVVTSHWVPAVDIKEEQGQFVITADVPGVDPKDIEITMDNGVLSIKGERTHEDSTEGKDYRRVERVHGTFYRRFSLPDTVDPERISAAGKNGVLEVTIPKLEKVQPRKITVS